MSGKSKCQSVTVFNETKAAKPSDPAQEVCVSWGKGGGGDGGEETREEKMRRALVPKGAALAPPLTSVRQSSVFNRMILATSTPQRK